MGKNSFREKYKYQLPRFSPYVLLNFPVLWEIDGKDLCISHVMKVYDKIGI